MTLLCDDEFKVVFRNGCNITIIYKKSDNRAIYIINENWTDEELADKFDFELNKKQKIDN